MKIALKNINKIKEGSISLNGLTVLTGVNDSGKSTVGKMLFALVKAFNNTKHFNENAKRREITRLANTLYRYFNMAELNMSDSPIPKEYKDFIQNLNNYDEETVAYIKYIEESLKTVEIMPRYKASILRCLDNISELLINSMSPERLFMKEMSSSLKAEFKSNVTTYGADISEVTFYDNDKTDPLHIVIKDNIVLEMSPLKMEGISIEDATLVESPLYLQMIDTLTQARTFKDSSNSSRATGFRSSYINYHSQDMAQKLDSIKVVDTRSMFFKKLEVSDVTGGKFVYDNSKRALVWIKEGRAFSPINVASGIKSFGVIQLLLETDSINENSILIWDEPENHLHPEWQLSFARLLVELAQKGIPIVLSTHSPYFIQAIRFFSHHTPLQDYVKYYMVEEQSDGLSIIDDVSNELNRVFAKLAAPMNGIINLPEE